MFAAPSPRSATLNAVADASPAIEIDRLRCAFDGAPVLEDVTLAIRPGAFVGIVGPSGAGKTTLLRALLGAMPRQAGSVHILGAEVTTGRVPRRGHVLRPDTVDWDIPRTIPAGLRSRP